MDWSDVVSGQQILHQLEENEHLTVAIENGCSHVALTYQPDSSAQKSDASVMVLEVRGPEQSFPRSVAVTKEIFRTSLHTQALVWRERQPIKLLSVGQMDSFA